MKTTSRGSVAGHRGAVVEVPLASSAELKRLPKGRSLALVEVAGTVLRVRFVEKAAPIDESAPMLTEAEQAVLGGGRKGVAAEAALIAAGRAAAAYEGLLESSLGVEEAATHLGVNPSRIRQRLAERSLYGIKDGSIWRLPAFQFAKRGLVPGIEGVLKALPPDLGPVAVSRWFKTPNPDLCTRDDEERPLTPLQWLAEGHRPELAAGFASAL